MNLKRLLEKMKASEHHHHKYTHYIHSSLQGVVEISPVEQQHGSQGERVK